MIQTEKGASSLTLTEWNATQPPFLKELSDPCSNIYTLTPLKDTLHRHTHKLRSDMFINNNKKMVTPWQSQHSAI
jgi:hypothetical protein